MQLVEIPPSQILDNEQKRESMSPAKATCTNLQVVRDPVDKRGTIICVQDHTVDDLVEANIVAVKIRANSIMTNVQINNPIRMDKRLWRITASNFGELLSVPKLQ